MSPRWEQFPSGGPATIASLVAAGTVEELAPSVDTGGGVTFSEARPHFVGAATNLVYNPKPISTSASVAPTGWQVQGSATATITWGTGATVDGIASKYFFCAGLAGCPTNTGLILKAGHIGECAPGDLLHLAVKLGVVTLTGCTLQFAISWRSGTDTAIGAVEYGSVLPGPAPGFTVAKFDPGAAPALAAGFKVYLLAANNFHVGDVMEYRIAELCFQNGTKFDYYFDGDTADTVCDWTGTADASTSTREAVVLQYAHRFVRATGGTIATCVWPGFDGDDGVQHMFAAQTSLAGDASLAYLCKGESNYWTFGVNDASGAPVGQAAIDASTVKRGDGPFYLVGSFDNDEVRLNVSGVEATVANGGNGGISALATIGSNLLGGSSASSDLGPVVFLPSPPPNASWARALVADTAVWAEPDRLMRDYLLGIPGATIDSAGAEAVAHRVAVRSTDPACIVFDGDSLTSEFTDAGVPKPYCYPLKVIAALRLTGAWDYHNFGVSGQDLTAMAADAATQVDTLVTGAHRAYICVAWEALLQSVHGYTDAQVIAAYWSYCDARRAAGYSVVAVTGTPATVSGSPGWEASRTVINAAIRADWDLHCDALADVAADHRIGDSGDQNDPVYFSADLIHMIDAGYAVVAEIVLAAIATIEMT